MYVVLWVCTSLGRSAPLPHPSYQDWGVWWILRGIIYLKLYGLPRAQSRAGDAPRVSVAHLPACRLRHVVAPRHSHRSTPRRRTRPVHAIATSMSSPAAASHLPRGEGEGGAPWRQLAPVLLNADKENADADEAATGAQPTKRNSKDLPRGVVRVKQEYRPNSPTSSAARAGGRRNVIMGIFHFPKSA